MLNCFQFVVRNHQGQERALLDSYYTSSHCTHKARPTPTCTLTHYQLRVVSQELQLGSQPANKKDALRNSAVFLSTGMLVRQAKGWSHAEMNSVVFSGSLMLEQFTIYEGAFMTAVAECDITCVLTLYKCLGAPDQMEHATRKGLYSMEEDPLELEVWAERERMKNLPVTLEFSEHNDKYHRGLSGGRMCVYKSMSVLFMDLKQNAQIRSQPHRC